VDIDVSLRMSSPSMEESLSTFLEGRRGTSYPGPEEIDYAS